MLDFAINAGNTASCGVISSGSPNCSASAKILYGVHAIRNAEKANRIKLLYE